MIKRILITGVTGFIGSRLAQDLLDQQAEIYGLAPEASAEVVNVSPLGLKILREIRVIRGDIRDVCAVTSALNASKPDVIFHLAGQSFVPRSFTNPLETIEINTLGTANLLDAIKTKDYDTKVIFAGSSEQYGLVILSNKQLNFLEKRYGYIWPKPKVLPEVPINEENPFRPLSPYAASKVHGESLMHSYSFAYGLNCIVCRGFNTEGRWRSTMFVTASIANQVSRLKRGEINKITVGNVNTFRDWSHIEDIVRAYVLVSQKANRGEVYNLGSQRTNSVLTYILLCLEEAGYIINALETYAGTNE